MRTQAPPPPSDLDDPSIPGQQSYFCSCFSPIGFAEVWLPYPFEFIGFSEETFPGRNATICAECQVAGFTPRFRHHVENLTALLAFVAADKGVTLAPAEVSQLPHPNAVFISLKPPVPSVVSAAAQRKDDPNPLLKELMNCCRSFQSPAKHIRKVRGTAVVTTKRARVRPDRA